MAQILPLKLVPERITVRFNFLDVLEWGEVLTLALSELDVVSGQDPDPDLMLRLQPVISGDGAEVSQQLRLGVAGVLYRVTIEATTSFGRTLVKSANLAVLPSDAITPLPFGVYYSSDLYPIDVVEGFDSSLTSREIDIVTAGVDSFRSTLAITWGNISNGFVAYSMLPEGIDASITLTTGTLAVMFIVYSNWPPEGINSTFVPTTGTITAILIQYTNGVPEGIDSSFLPLSGTIV